jgi:hypothetical protein
MAAGEWVRDKYLNKKSNKLNLVFLDSEDKTTSHTLATMIKDYEKQTLNNDDLSDEVI